MTRRLQGPVVEPASVKAMIRIPFDDTKVNPTKFSTMQEIKIQKRGETLLIRWFYLEFGDSDVLSEVCLRCV